MPIRTILGAVDVVRELPRYKEILQIIFKYGFRDIIKWAHLQGLLAITEAHPRREGPQETPWQVRFRMMLEELGPIFVKLGQILSTRRDIVPESLVQELAKLQNQAAPFAFADAVVIIEAELKRPWHEVFAKLEETPVAAASISQVHRGTLMNGDKVAVKVQRPGIEKVASVDLSILLDIAGFVEDNFLELDAVNPRGLAQEFSRTLLRELDFSEEVRNTIRFARQFKGKPVIHVPHVHEELCSRRLMVMEYVTGHRIDDVPGLQSRGIDTVSLSENICKLMFEQMFEHGFFHADPHPGNLAVLPGGVIAVYDCGMMGHLRRSMRENLAAFVYGLVEARPNVVANALLAMSEDGFVDNHSMLAGDLEEFSREYLDRQLGEIRLARVLNRMLDLLARHRIKLRSDLYLGIKAISQLESVGKRLNPTINVIQFGEPFATKAIAGKFDPRRLAREIPEVVFSSLDMIKGLPDDLRDLYHRVKSGKFALPMQHTLNTKGFEPMRQTIDRAAHLFSAGIVTAAVLVSSSILVLAKLPPLVGDTSIIGAGFFMIGFLMFLRMAFRSWRDGGL